MAKMVASINENEYKQFEILLINLQSTDNDIRTKAEQAYDEVLAEKKLLLLFNCLGGTQSDELSSFAAVLLRRVFFGEFPESFVKLPPETKSHIQGQLLLAIEQDAISHSLRKKICDVAAELARKLIDDEGNNHWPEFLKFLFDSASSPNYLLKEASLLMFSAVPGVFGNLQVRYMEVIKQMLLQCLSDTSNEVRFAAIKALTSFICANESESNIYKYFADCLPLVLQELNIAETKQEPEVFEQILKNMVDLCEVSPNFFRSQLDTLFQLCLMILNPTMSDECRNMALEIVVTMCESAPAMVRKFGMNTISQIIPLVLNMMINLEDEDWETADDNTDDDNDSDPIIGESSLDRFACALGGKTMLPLVMSCVPEMLNNANWKFRHAALMAISAIGEGCNKQMETILVQVVDAIVPHLRDPHPRVRYAACNAMGQMATDFAPIFEKKFHEKLIPALIKVLHEETTPRVQAHAGAALVNFFEECPKLILTSYLDSIVEKLKVVLELKFKELVAKRTKLVLEQVVVTLASVADTCEEKFCKHYDKFMPCLKYIIKNATDPELKLLRGKTIECISLIGLAVGKDKFINDASEVMGYLLSSQTNCSEMSDDDPQLSYMISAWARICKIMGRSFAPYLPHVMPPVMKTAGLKPEIAVLDSDDMKAVEDDEDDWQFITLGEQQNFGIKTAGLEEKATACQMLVCYARELKDDFSPYVEQVVKLMIPMLKFYFHDGVRSAAGECLPYLLESAQKLGDNYVQEMWRFILPELLQAIESEPEQEVLSEFMHSFAQCVETLGNQCLVAEHMNSLMKVLDVRLNEHFERSVQRQAKRKEEDYDEVLEENLLEQDDGDTYLLSKIADILHALFATYKSEFFPYFDMILHHFVHLVQPDRPWSEKQWGICVFDDVIEHGGPACSKYQQHFLQPLHDGLINESPEVRQAAAYGVGMIGQFAGSTFAQICADSLSLLIKMIDAPDSRSVENINATENAIAAVTKIMMHNNTLVTMDELIPMWLNWLPVWEDLDEAPHVYNLLCTLLEQNHRMLLGDDNCNLPRIVMIFAEAFVKEAIELTSDVGKRTLTIINYIQSNGEVFQACVAQLGEAQREALCSALSTPPQ